MGEICVEATSSKEKVVTALHFRSAWDVDSEVLVNLAVKSGVDIKLYAYERGGEFNRDIQIIGGKVVKDETITFDDYVWECQCPLIGG